jgi:hypothetical protein
LPFWRERLFSLGDAKASYADVNPALGTFKAKKYTLEAFFMQPFETTTLYL